MQPLPEGALNEDAAIWLSLGGTMASLGTLVVAGEMAAHGNNNATTVGVIGAVGTMFAPSFGHWYARRIVSRGLVLRLAGVALGALSAMVTLATCEDECSIALPALLGITGIGSYVVGMFDDVVTASRDVRSYNEHLHNVSIVPVVRRDNHSVGLAIAGQF
jgi:hypothetical protein